MQDYQMRAHELYVEESEETLVIERPGTVEQFLDRLSAEDKIFFKNLREIFKKKSHLKLITQLDEYIRQGERGVDNALAIFDQLREDAGLL